MRGISVLWRRGAVLLTLPVFVCCSATNLSGCATYNPKPSASFPEAKQAGDLVLKPGDEIQVLYTYWSDLDVQQQVRPDGKISLKMVGDVDAAGKTPQQLREELHQLYADKLRDPDISVVVAGLGSHRVYVGGEVLQPGLIPINGRLTLLEAVMQAGGPVNRSARLRDVILVREQDGKRYARTYNLKESFANSESESVELQPYDVVYIPRTAIDRLDQWVDQYVNGLIPRNFQATYVWSNEQSQETLRTRSTNVNLGQFTPTNVGIQN
jgi:polysaccharide export outer membrane protein